jgi:hypothetical protein
MARLTALGMIVLTIVGFVVELWGYWKMASSARTRRSHAPIPMHDEVDGVPTQVAPDETGTHRTHGPDSRRGVR